MESWSDSLEKKLQNRFRLSVITSFEVGIKFTAEISKPQKRFLKK